MRRSAVIVLGLLAPGAAVAQQAPQQQPVWAQMPRMQLERQFAGPLQDTVIQRWRDPGDGTICYIYLPISAPHSPPTANGFVQYGPNIIGSINCMPAPPVAAATAGRKP
jgi:hypothetical protein